MIIKCNWWRYYYDDQINDNNVEYYSNFDADADNYDNYDKNDDDDVDNDNNFK